MVNVLLATPSSGAGEVMLHLYTHDFFLNNQRISSKFLGAWSKGVSSSKRRNFEWFPGKLNDFYGFKVREFCIRARIQKEKYIVEISNEK